MVVLATTAEVGETATQGKSALWGAQAGVAEDLLQGMFFRLTIRFPIRSAMRCHHDSVLRLGRPGSPNVSLSATTFALLTIDNRHSR